MRTHHRLLQWDTAQKITVTLIITFCFWGNILFHSFLKQVITALQGHKIGWEYCQLLVACSQQQLRFPEVISNSAPQTMQRVRGWKMKLGFNYWLQVFTLGRKCLFNCRLQLSSSKQSRRKSKKRLEGVPLKTKREQENDNRQEGRSKAACNLPLEELSCCQLMRLLSQEPKRALCSQRV